MERKFVFSIGEFYHLYNRGTEKRVLFEDTRDHERFLSLLYLCNSKKPVTVRELPKGALFDVERGKTLTEVGAYCLMPNHFHILVKEKIENGVSAFMKKLSTAYSMYFNKKYNRTGSLFEGSFKATHAIDDEYLKYLFSYIHLNPAKLIDPHWKTSEHAEQKKLLAYLDNYRYSSLIDYKNPQRKEKNILNKDAFPEYFSTIGEIEESITDWFYNKTFPQG